MVLAHRRTANEVRQLPDEPGMRVECVDGQLLMSPSPRLPHQSAALLFDRVVKRGRYQRSGIEYWIVDLDARLVERWTPECERPEIISGQLVWRPVGVTRPLAVDLDALIAEAMGER